MGSVLMCIFYVISISNIIFYIACFKGSITSKRDLAMEYFGYNESYASLNGCVDN